MNAIQEQGLRSASIRVALATTLLVSAVYLAIAAAVVLIVDRGLTGKADRRLGDALARVVGDPSRPDHAGGPGGPGGSFRSPREGPFDPTRIVWTVAADGSVTSSDSSAVLPDAYRNVASPATVGIGDEEVRITGATLGDGRRLIVGESMASVANARSTIILAEVAIAPPLLAVVFAGAVAIGRRVAGPIERARQRQMEFTADASHELRTPLSVIEAQTSLALTQDRSEDWYRRAFERVDKESKRIRRLLEDLLWLARFDATRGQPHAEPIDVAVLASQAADRFAIVAEARKLSLSVEATAEPHVVTAPPEWLDRLLGVLLDNACKYSPEGGAVRVSVASESGRTRVTVDDSGPGIPVEERERIFDRFHRATSTGSGAGLGLAIADAIVGATNGRWKIDTAPGGGARMSVSWPRAFSGRREVALGATSPTHGSSA